MKKILVFLFVSVYSITNAQINSSFDIIGSLDYSYFYLASKSDDITTEDIKNEIHNWYNGKMNFRTGFNYNKRFLSKYLFKTGINFVSIGAKTKKIRLSDYKWSDQNNEPGIWTQTITDYYYIEIPLIIRFEFNENNFIPFYEIGISPNFFISEKRKVVTENGSSTRFYDESYRTNNIKYVASVAIGTNYCLNSKTQIFVQTTGRYHLNKTNKSKTGSISIHIYSIGLEMGTRIKIN